MARQENKFWTAIKQHRGWFLLGSILAFLLWVFPLGIATAWPALVRDKTLPEWLASNGWPTLKTLIILWVILTAVVIAFSVVRIFTVSFRTRLTADDPQPLPEHETPQYSLPTGQAYSIPIEMLRAGAIADIMRPAQPSLEEIQRHYELKKPNLTFLKSSPINAYEDEHGRIIEGNNGRDLPFHARVAEFNNSLDPDRSIGPTDGVSARLTYRFFDNTERIEVIRGVWVTHGARVDFGVNDTRRLVVAAIEEERYVTVLNGSYSEKPERIRLPNDLAKVEVSLVSESQGKLIKRFDLMLEVRRDSDVLVDLVVAELRYWKFENLLRLMVEGGTLLQRSKREDYLASLGGIAILAKDEEALEKEVNAWIGKVSPFLTTHFSAQDNVRFVAAVTAKPGQETFEMTATIADGFQVLAGFKNEVDPKINN